MSTLWKVASVAAMTWACSATLAADKPDADKGLRFNSHGVLDLADRSLTIEGGKPVAVATLDAAEAGRIFAAPGIGEEPPGLRFSDDEYGCKTPSRKCSLEHERKLLDAAGVAARRDGKRLTITPSSGTPVTFVDWKMPTTQTADGDDETHWYLGSVAGSGYHRVEVQFGHDAPGNFLIDPQGGKVAFVHNGADLVALAPDGKALLTWNALNPPFSLRVAALDAAGPRLAMQCEAAEGGPRVEPVFKGWTGSDRFAFVLEIGEQGKSQPRVAASAQQREGHWQLSASDIARLESIGLSCHSA
jgi:hypothetical protein